MSTNCMHVQKHKSVWNLLDVKGVAVISIHYLWRQNLLFKLGHDHSMQNVVAKQSYPN